LHEIFGDYYGENLLQVRQVSFSNIKVNNMSLVFTALFSSERRERTSVICPK